MTNRLRAEIQEEEVEKELIVEEKEPAKESLPKARYGNFSKRTSIR